MEDVRADAKPTGLAGDVAGGTTIDACGRRTSRWEAWKTGKRGDRRSSAIKHRPPARVTIARKQAVRTPRRRRTARRQRGMKKCGSSCPGRGKGTGFTGRRPATQPPGRRPVSVPSSPPTLTRTRLNSDTTELLTFGRRRSHRGMASDHSKARRGKGSAISHGRWVGPRNVDRETIAHYRYACCKERPEPQQQRIFWLVEASEPSTDETVFLTRQANPERPPPTQIDYRIVCMKYTRYRVACAASSESVGTTE